MKIPDFSPDTVAAQPKKDRILDAAEELFSIHGYDGVTLRQIAQKAGVDVALANYHFGKKEALFEATFYRRAPFLNRIRLASLQEVEDLKGEDLTVLDIITAYLTPIQELQGSDDSRWQNYSALAAYVNTSSVWGKKLMSNNYDPLAAAYVESLGRVLPNASLERLHWCYQYLSGALTITLANTGRIDRLSNGLCKSNDIRKAYDLMIPFIVAGFEKVCSES